MGMNGSGFAYARSAEDLSENNMGMNGSGFFIWP